MVKQLQKTRQRKQYHYETNRKAQKKKQQSTGKIKCLEVRKAYDFRHSMPSNIKDMGLAFDVNKVLGLPNNKRERVLMKKKLANGFVEEDNSDAEQAPAEGSLIRKSKKHVAEGLEQDSKALRESNYKLPNGQVKWISYLMDTYGLNYKLMAKDKKNHDQETWRQLRAKCRKLMSIPQQFAKYLEERNLLEEDEKDESNPRWQEYNTDVDDDM